MPTELFVSRVGGQCWAAVREDGRAVEFRVESHEQSPRLGRIVKGRVTRIVPALAAAFVDAGLERDAFLHVSELEPPAAGAGPGGDTIGERLEPGQELLVQVSRETAVGKGDRVTCLPGIPGRLLVLLARQPEVAVSRRIEQPAERARLTAALEGLCEENCGFVARTAARGAEEGALRAEAARLLTLWHDLERRYGGARAPAILHEEPPLAIRLLRDTSAEGPDRVVFDDEAERSRALAFLDRVDPTLASRIQLERGSPSLFVANGLDQELRRALRRRVWLRCGGFIVIEETEALVSIDVNTGKSVDAASQEDTVLRTNLQAAEEIARQLRLRDLGGIVVVDFVDMERVEQRERLLQTMRDAVRRDPARSKVVGLSDIGLMQLTRKRSRSGLRAALTVPCRACAGRGRVLDDACLEGLGAGSGEGRERL